MQQQLVERQGSQSEAQKQEEQAVEQVLKEEKETADLSFEVLDTSDGVTVQRTETVLEATATLQSDGQRDIRIDESVSQDTFTLDPTYDVDLPDAWSVIAEEQPMVAAAPVQRSPWEFVQLHQLATPVIEAEDVLHSTVQRQDAAVYTPETAEPVTVPAVEATAPVPASQPAFPAQAAGETLTPYEAALAEDSDEFTATDIYAALEASEPASLTPADRIPDPISRPDTERGYDGAAEDIVVYDNLDGADDALETVMQVAAPEQVEQSGEAVPTAYDVGSVVNEGVTRIVYGTDGPVSAVKALEDVFAATSVPGAVETMTYESSEAFTAADSTEYAAGDTVEAQYVDIAEMDMDRTEYFINGELATDVIDAYDLASGDTLTFVESPAFANGGGHSGTAPTLDDVAPTAESVYEVAVEDVGESAFDDVVYEQAAVGEPLLQQGGGAYAAS